MMCHSRSFIFNEFVSKSTIRRSKNAHHGEVLMTHFFSHDLAQGHRSDDFGATSLFQDSPLILSGSPTSRSLVLMYLLQSQQSDSPALKSMEVWQPSNIFQKVWPMDKEFVILMKFHDLSFQIFYFK